MKKILLSLFMVASVAALVPTVGHAQFNGNYEGYLGAKDTLTDTDTTTYEVTITGPKHCVSFQCDVTKLTGTVAGKFDIYGSVDGVTYETALAATSVTKANATGTYVISFASNKYKKYKVLSISSGTNTHAQRVYLLYRNSN
jgi:hypothetical protein